jgi:hypothetical protein
MGGTPSNRLQNDLETITARLGTGTCGVGMSGPGFAVRATKEDGRWVMDKARWRKLCDALKEGQYVITVERYVANRSLKQNAYYHAVIVELLADYWGLEHDDAHELIKLHCNSKTVEVVNKETGEVEETTIARSTASLNKEEWGLFIERCQRWAAMEFGVVIPDPDPEWMFNAA